MATLSPPVTVHVPQTGKHGGSSLPPVYGGGGDGGRGDGSPDYVSRLRRARLGLVVAIAPIVMLFVAFTSAYIVRQGLPTLDEKTNTYVRDWTPVNLPIALLLVNTGLLLLSSVAAELARRQITRQAALAPVRSIPDVSLGLAKRPSLARNYGRAWWRLSDRPVDRLAFAGRARLLPRNQRQQFVRVFAHRYSRHPPLGRPARCYSTPQPVPCSVSRLKRGASWWT
jgi:hypothetical protein